MLLIRSFEARLALLRGDTEAWGRWLDSTAEAPAAEPPDASSAIESPRVTRAWALLALGDPVQLAQAEAELGVLQRQLAAQNDRARLIQVFALQALACHARGDRPTGLTMLERALANGQRGGFVRTFVDLGAPMARMVSSLSTRGRPSGYLSRVRSAFATNHQAAERDGPSDAPGSEALVGPLVEPLTWREQDVLELLGRRLSNKEIARELEISPLTVKKHAESIYRKLQAKGRREAADRAQALGLL